MEDYYIYIQHHIGGKPIKLSHTNFKFIGIKKLKQDIYKGVDVSGAGNKPVKLGIKFDYQQYQYGGHLDQESDQAYKELQMAKHDVVINVKAYRHPEEDKDYTNDDCEVRYDNKVESGYDLHDRDWTATVGHMYFTRKDNLINLRFQ